MDWISHQLEQSPDMPAKVDEITDPAAPPPEELEPVEALTVEALKKAAVEAGLKLDEEIYAQLLAALISGKHVILTGPPGTAKTTLAQVVADLARRTNVCTGFMPTTATADWTTYETIGGLRPAEGGSLEFIEGQFLEAIRKREWLIIDELNRAQFDRAFGQLFTLLSDHPVVLPYSRPEADGKPLVLLPDKSPAPAFPADVLKVPKTWRIIGTMNVFDKSLLFQMSFALMRRFAFIEVAVPSDEIFNELIDIAADEDEKAAALTKKLLDVRKQKPIGPSVFIDIARFFKSRNALKAAEDGQLIFEGFYSYLLPQFEGIEDSAGLRLYNLVAAMIEKAPLKAKLRETLVEVLGVHLPTPAKSEDPVEEESDDDLDSDDQPVEP